MSDRPTPETDADAVQKYYLQGPECREYVTAHFARRLERERDEARSQRNALAASLEYIASAGFTARQCEDEATKMLALVFEKEDGE